jgi:hypothetical protein
LIGSKLIFLLLVVRNLAERAAEIGDAAHPAEEFLDIVDAGRLHEIRPEMVGRILQHHPEIFEVEAVAKRRFDADVGGDADEDDVADAARPKRRIELRVEEGAVAGLVQRDVAGLGLQRLDQIIIPAAAREQLAAQLGPLRASSSARWTCASWASPAARLDIIGVPAVLQIDDRHAGAAPRSRAPWRSGRSCRRRRECRTRLVDIAAGRGIGILHVDHDDRGLRGHDAIGSGRAGSVTAVSLTAAEPTLTVD